MKRTLQSKVSFSHLYVVSTACLLLLLTSCEKEAKSTASAQSPEDAKQAASLSALDAPVLDTAGLVAWFSFNGGSLADRSIYHNRIIFNNAQPTTDRYGVDSNAYYFNGNGSYMEIKNSASLSPDREISLFAIVKFDDFYAGPCHGNRILNKGSFDGAPGFYLLGTSDDYYTHSMNCSQAVDKAHETFESGFCNTGARDSTDYVQTGHWYHLVYTYGSGIASFYVDGRLTDSHPVRLQPSVGTDDLFIGTTNKNNTQFPYWLNGSVDQVAVYNRALNANQVARLSAF